MISLFVVFNSLRELKHGRARALSNPPWSLVSSLLLGVKTAGMFLLICVLWSIWTCESFSSWASMWEFLWRGVPEAGSAFPKLLLIVAAVIITVTIMLFAADPLARFIDRNPTLVMLALAFLVMIGLVLIADGFGVHVPKGYIYVAMGFSVAVEGLNMIKRNRRQRQAAARAEAGA